MPALFGAVRSWPWNVTERRRAGSPAVKCRRHKSPSRKRCQATCPRLPPLQSGIEGPAMENAIWPASSSPTALTCWRTTTVPAPSRHWRKLGELRINPTGQVLTTQALVGGRARLRDHRLRPPDAGRGGVFRPVARPRRLPALRRRHPQHRRRRGERARRPGDARDARVHCVGRRDGARIHRRPGAPCHRPPRSTIAPAGEAAARMGRQLKGSTLGIIGYGAIGAYLAPLGTRSA